MDESTRNYLKSIAKKGGQTTRARYGKEHYQKLAAHMNQVRKNKQADQKTETESDHEE